MKDEDKTRKKLLEEIRYLRESEAKCRALIEESRDAMVITTRGGRIVNLRGGPRTFRISGGEAENPERAEALRRSRGPGAVQGGNRKDGTPEKLSRPAEKHGRKDHRLRHEHGGPEEERQNRRLPRHHP